MSTTFPTPYVSGTELQWLRPVANWLRWGALALAALLVAAGQRPVSDLQLSLAAAPLLVFAITRSSRRLGARAPLRSVLALEPAVALLAVVLSGGWASPLTIYLSVPVLFAAMAIGVRVGWLVAGVVAALSLHELGDRAGPVVASEVVQTLGPVVAAAVVGFIARRVVRQTEDDQSQTLGRLQELAHVNALLSTLHDLVRTTSAPLSIDAVMATVGEELEELFEPDTIMLLLGDQGGRYWRTVYAHGGEARPELADAELPTVLRTEDRGSRPVLVEQHDPDGGLAPGTVAGTYLWLWSRGSATALLAIEYRQQHRAAPRELEMLERLGSPLGLALDNAVWFRRLRTLGAEEERQRIGAELHDQFAQSLVYVAMELDRTSARHPEDTALDDLRGEVRSTLADLRETLRELRLRCTDERGLVEVLVEHLDRFGDRYGLVTSLEAAEVPRFPLPIEDQMLRIVQDLLLLARREAEATRIVVSVQAEPGRLRVVVSDDGSGRSESDLGHEAVRLLTLVRERADAVGGLVDVFARPGEGTEVAVTVRGLY